MCATCYELPSNITAISMVFIDTNSCHNLSQSFSPFFCLSLLFFCVSLFSFFCACLSSLFVFCVSLFSFCFLCVSLFSFCCFSFSPVLFLCLFHSVSLLNLQKIYKIYLLCTGQICILTNYEEKNKILFCSLSDHFEIRV